MLKFRLPRLAHNWLTALGAALATVAGMTMIGLLVVSFSLEEQSNIYFGIFLYTVLPLAVASGLLLVPIGMFREWRRWKKGGELPAASWPLVDLNRPAHRNALAIFVLGTLLFVVLSAVGSYEAYHYSESVAFCGTTCHTVMKPEHTTYLKSPHARVACTACHVGPGADWYVKAKLSGAYQIYAAARGIYPRPIPTPISNLRPAQQTCEQCHWPEHIYGALQRQENHYLYDDANTPWPINMLIKVGGGDPTTGQTAGIHWHMNIGVNVEYIARDERRQEIPWVRVTDRVTGRVTVYQDSETPLTPEEVGAATPRVMDCMDCHNRPSHIFRSPDEAIDQAILTGKISREIPGIKAIAVEAMAAEYESEEQARREIANRMTEHYRKERPEVHAQRRAAIDQAIVAAQEAYAANIFPVMKARWSAYPANIGHFYSIGCMRCHNGRHTDEQGVVLTKACSACHIILAQGSGERAEVAATQEGLEFAHPEDIGEAWKDIGCYECHTGVRP